MHRRQFLSSAVLVAAASIPNAAEAEDDAAVLIQRFAAALSAHDMAAFADLFAEIDIEAEIKNEPMQAQFDRRLISQALTNIIKNATEAIEAVPAAELGKGRIDVIAARDNDDIVIDVIDNGIGLPKVSRARLLEPYVTTREKGTGLGLAIVGRVLEDHGGRIELHDAADIRPDARGAWMRLRFAISGHAPKPEAKEQASETKQPAFGTVEPADATNNETKIEAATGS